MRTFGVIYDHNFLNLQITRSDIRPHIKWAVSLGTAYGDFNLPQGFVWVNILTLSLPRVAKLGSRQVAKLKRSGQIHLGCENAILGNRFTAS